jgi:nicotinamidase-related amidase
MQYLLFALAVYFSVCNSQSLRFQYSRLDKTNTALLLVDHQSGLSNGVMDINQIELKNNLIALAKVAKLFELPVVVSTSQPDSPNGPFLQAVLDELPATYVIIPRPGEINAWDNIEFQTAVNETGATKFIVSGIEVGVTFVALSLRESGYDVYMAFDSSPSYDHLVGSTGKIRMVTAGIIPMTWYSIACELQVDWSNTETVDGFTEILKQHLPWYANLMESGKSSEQPKPPTVPSPQPAQGNQPGQPTIPSPQPAQGNQPGQPTIPSPQPAPTPNPKGKGEVTK